MTADEAKTLQAEYDAQLCEWLPYGSGLAGKTYAEAIRGVGMGGQLAIGFQLSSKVQPPGLILRATVAAALPESWYADSPIEFRVQKMVEQWQKLHEREKQVANALVELRKRIATERSALYGFVVEEIDATIAKLGLQEE